MNQNKIIFIFIYQYNFVFLKVFLQIVIVIIYIIYNYYYSFFIAKNFLKTNRIRYYFIKNTFNKFINQLPYYNHSHKYSNKIFWCWFQGKEDIPKLYQTCLNSIKNNIKGYEIIIISEDNMNLYVHFPSYIIKKFKNNIISKTHLSDLLRLELLIKYGGTWIDASVLITKYNETFFNKDLFFFQDFYNKNIVGSSWFISSEKDSPILKTTLDLLYEYWRKNNILFF